MAAICSCQPKFAKLAFAIPDVGDPQEHKSLTELRWIYSPPSYRPAEAP